ncbi:hypothetical protein Tco_0105816 [Tanacetum coccineum]
MYNNIMATGSRDRPLMLVTGRYAQWQSRFMRYVDTKPNGEALRKCILQGPYKLSNIIILGQPTTDESLAVLKQTIPKTFSNITPENKAHYDAEKEAIHLILTGVGHEIYSSVDACKTTHDMWIAIKRLQQGESLNKQDVKTSLFWEFGILLQGLQNDGESIESYYSRVYKMMNEMVRNQLEVATMQKEVNEICAKKIAKNTNPLALVAAAQQYPESYYQAPKSHKSYAPPSKQSSSTRSHVSTRHKGKEIAKPITPLSEPASEEDSDPEQAQRDKEMQKNLALIAKYFKNLYKPTNNNLRTSSNSRNKNVDTTPRYVNEDHTGQFRNQMTMTVAGARETVGSQQSNWLEDTDEEIEEQELEAHYSFMAKIQEVLPVDSRSDAEPLEKVQYDVEYNVFANERQHSEQPKPINNTCVVEKVNSNVIPDSSNMYDNDNQADQKAEECDDESVVLATLIANLQLDTKENKKFQKQLKKVNTSLTQELKECKYTLEETNRTLGESNITQDRYLVALHDKEVELAKYKTFKDHTIENDTLEHKLKETLGLLAQKKHDIKEGLKIKAYETSVDKEKNDEFVKQSLLTKSSYEAPKSSTYNGRPTFANPMYFKKAQSENPCLYETPYDKDDLANIFAPDKEETLNLKQKSRSKLNKDIVKPYDYTKQNSVYEI